MGRRSAENGAARLSVSGPQPICVQTRLPQLRLSGSFHAIAFCLLNVSYWHKADVTAPLVNVRC